MSLDPRTKLVLSLVFGLSVIMARALPEMASEMALLLCVIVLKRMGRDYGRWCCFILPMAGFFALITGWSAGWEAARVSAGKLVVLTTIFFVFFKSVYPEDLGNALVRSGLPFSMAFMISASLQFIPIMKRKAAAVMDAQRARGIPLRPGWRLIRYYPAFLIPLLLQSFQLAEELAEAMEARGFGRPHRSFLKTYRLGGMDWGVLAAAAALLCALVYFKLDGGRMSTILYRF